MKLVSDLVFVALSIVPVLLWFGHETMLNEIDMLFNQGLAGRDVRVYCESILIPEVVSL